MPPPPVVLTPRFVKGWTQELWFGMDVRENKQDSKRPNESGELRTQQQLVLTLTCLTADPTGECSFEVRIDEVKLDLNGRGANVFFDSTLAPSPVYNEETNKRLAEETPIKSAIKPLIGTSFTILVDSKGNLVRAVGGQAFEAAQGNPLSSAIFNVGALRELLGPVLTTARVPNRPVQLAERWRVEEPVSLSTGKVVIGDEYSLTRLMDGVAVVTMEGKITPEKADAPVKVVGSRRQGLIEVESASGMLKNFEFQEDLRMSGKAIEDGRELTALTVRRLKIAPKAALRPNAAPPASGGATLPR
ncbi:MAG: hypothetical protein KGS45_10170 [Planctomycetes bacterium]|nr:hypothetical protein [Planctomycetota bacterium]